MITTPKVGDLVMIPDGNQARVEGIDGKQIYCVWPMPGLAWVRQTGTFRQRDLRRVHASKE